MRINFFLIFVASMGIVVSCSTQNNPPHTVQEVLSTAREVTPRVLSVDSILSNPYQIQYIDGYLIWIDNQKEKLLTIYDPQQEKIVRQTIKEGKGPLEILPPVHLMCDPVERTIGLLSRRTSQYTVYRLENLIRDTLLSPVRAFRFEFGGDRCVKMGRDRYLSAYYFLDTVASAAIYDTTGKMLGWVNTFPQEIREIPSPTDRYIKGQSNMVYLPKEQVLGVAYTSHLDRIQFFDMSDDQPLLIREYGVPELKDQYSPSSLHACATDQFIYVLWMNNTDRERYILKFDAHGEVVDCIHVNKCSIFCVSSDDKKIYTVGSDDNLEPIVVEYQL